MTEKIYDIAVIGAGAAGQMAALRSVLNNKDTIVFTGDKKTAKKSRAMWVTKVVNMPYTADIPRPILAATKSSFEWIENDEHFKNKLSQVEAAVTELKKDQEIFLLKDADSNEYKAKYVILCTGIMDMQPEINGSIKPVLPYANNQHIDYCVRCDGHHSVGKITATIGHGAAAAWVAIMLHERYQPPAMKIFTNGKNPEFPEETLELLEKYKIKVVTEKITEIKGDPKEKMEAFVLENDGLEEVELAFAMLGQIAYNDLAKQLGAELTEKGNVVCNAKGESSVAGLYVAGDLRDSGKYQIYTAWDQAVDSADDIDAKLRLVFRNS